FLIHLLLRVGQTLHYIEGGNGGQVTFHALSSAFGRKDQKNSPIIRLHLFRWIINGEEKYGAIQ
ncbi:hypothetical protein, partial [Altererythrobacter lauratis]